MLELNDQNFELEIQNTNIILVDFWMVGCAPCEMMASIIEEVAEEFKGKVKVGKLNVRENPQAAQKYEIKGVPTLIIFKEGQPEERAVGLRSKEVIVEKINSLL